MSRPRLALTAPATSGQGARWLEAFENDPDWECIIESPVEPRYSSSRGGLVLIFQGSEFARLSWYPVEGAEEPAALPSIVSEFIGGFPEPSGAN